MQTKNNYNIHWESYDEEGDGIFNGDIGFIESIDLRRDAIVIDFNGRRAAYTKEQLTEVELAYAKVYVDHNGSDYIFEYLNKLSTLLFAIALTYE